MQDTIFGKIVRGEIPVEKLYEDDICLAFPDVAPQAPVHILIIPKEAYVDAAQTPLQVLGHVMEVAARIGKERCPAGFRLVTNIGAGGGQSVFHLHIHVIGGRPLNWPPG